ncbi:MAG TPA: glycosyltransferase [Blastocatellia bacterium]|nr:glycosyltransferase [Blastocatellia bacterium]
MSVYNGSSQLARTIESVLAQDGVEFEFVIVDDGSTDETPQILDDYARRDNRIRLIRQQNEGLTKALIRGCAAAKGTFIARQDAGDISLPGRLEKQLSFFKEASGVSLVSCGTRFVGPQTELLYEVSQDPSDATQRILTLDASEIRGPSSHPSTMFLKASYEAVGGYRSAFYFGQDLDLWVRLAEVGTHAVINEVLYEAAINVQSISGLYRREQMALKKIIVESARLRRNGKDDGLVLKRAELLKTNSKRPRSRRQRARALYFIGSCLSRRGNPGAFQYFRQAAKTCPLHLKSVLKLMYGGLTRQ